MLLLDLATLYPVITPVNEGRKQLGATMLIIILLDLILSRTSLVKSEMLDLLNKENTLYLR